MHMVQLISIAIISYKTFSISEAIMILEDYMYLTTHSYPNIQDIVDWLLDCYVQFAN